MIEIKNSLLEEITLGDIHNMSDSEILKYHKLFMVTMKDVYPKIFDCYVRFHVHKLSAFKLTSDAKKIYNEYKIPDLLFFQLTGIANSVLVRRLVV